MATKEIYVTDEDGDEFELVLEWHMSKYIPAKIWGDPDSCYPAEGGELEIERIRIYEFGRWYEVSQEEVEEVGYDFDSLEEDIVADNDDDGYGRDPDDFYDSRFDREEDDRACDNYFD